jgi:hypothetical protein
MNFSRLAPTMFFLLLLLSAPFFIIQTKNDATGRVLADDFKQLSYFVQEDELYNITFVDNSLYDNSSGTLISSTNWARTDRIPLLNNSIRILDVSYITALLFWDDDIYIGYYIGYIGQSGPDPKRISEFITEYPDIPSGTTHFALMALKISSPGWNPDSISFANFSTTQIEYEGDFNLVVQDYYDVMENARTADYINPFGVFNFILNLPQIIGNFKPLAIVGVDESVSEITDTVNSWRAQISPYNWIKYINPINWRTTD